MTTNRIKQYQVGQYAGRIGKAKATGVTLAFFAFTKAECVELLERWLKLAQPGWKATRSTATVRRGEVSWKVLTGTTVP